MKVNPKTSIVAINIIIICTCLKWRFFTLLLLGGLTPTSIKIRMEIREMKLKVTQPPLNS